MLCLLPVQTYSIIPSFYCIYTWLNHLSLAKQGKHIVEISQIQ